MHRLPAGLAVVFSAIILLGAIPSGAQSLAQRELGRSLDTILDAEPFTNAFWGVIVMDARTGSVIYERYPDKSFVPASNAKLYSTAAALEVLGPQYVYETQLVASGSVIQGVLEGDIIIRGSGDPSFGSRLLDGHRLAVFRAWADSLRAAGISRIDGDVVGDPRIFDDLPLGRGWNWDDEPYAYSAEVSGLSYNDNTVDFTLSAGRSGGPASITWQPSSTTYVAVENQTVTVSADASLEQRYYRDRGTNIIRFETRLPAGREISPSVSVTDPAHYAAHVLMEELRRQGIEITGQSRSVNRRTSYATRSEKVIARHRSLPLGRVVDEINKRSQNLFAEQVLKTIGVASPVRPSRHEAGSAAMGIARSKHIWATAGIDTSMIRLVDGSGLSRHNFVTPRMTASLLRYMWNHPDSEVRMAYFESLPISGIDGTLQSRLGDGRIRGSVRAKTGTLSGASALAGYAVTQRGDNLIFVIMANHFTATAREARAAQDAVVRRIVTW